MIEQNDGYSRHFVLSHLVFFYIITKQAYKNIAGCNAFFIPPKLYICTTNYFFMAQKITLSLKESNVKFVKNHALKTQKSVSKIVDDYLELLKKIDNAYKKEKLNPFVKEFGGMISTGKNETVNSIF